MRVHLAVQLLDFLLIHSCCFFFFFFFFSFSYNGAETNLGEILGATGVKIARRNASI